MKDVNLMDSDNYQKSLLSKSLFTKSSLNDGNEDQFESARETRLRETRLSDVQTMEMDDNDIEHRIWTQFVRARPTSVNITI